MPLMEKLLWVNFYPDRAIFRGGASSLKFHRLLNKNVEMPTNGGVTDSYPASAVTRLCDSYNRSWNPKVMKSIKLVRTLIVFIIVRVLAQNLIVLTELFKTY